MVHVHRRQYHSGLDSINEGQESKQRENCGRKSRKKNPPPPQNPRLQGDSGPGGF